MKRSHSVRLVLIGSVSAGMVTGCGPTNAPSPTPLSDSQAYTNNHYVPGAGYYHAPYRAWYPRPYNDYDPQTRRYYYGGRWMTEPDRSYISVSRPSALAAGTAQASRTDVSRGGFGSSSRSHSSISS